MIKRIRPEIVLTYVARERSVWNFTDTIFYVQQFRFFSLLTSGPEHQHDTRIEPKTKLLRLTLNEDSYVGSENQEKNFYTNGRLLIVYAQASTEKA